MQGEAVPNVANGNNDPNAFALLVHLQGAGLFGAPVNVDDVLFGITIPFGHPSDSILSQNVTTGEKLTSNVFLGEYCG